MFFSFKQMDRWHRILNATHENSARRSNTEAACTFVVARFSVTATCYPDTVHGNERITGVLLLYRTVASYLIRVRSNETLEKRPVPSKRFFLRQLGRFRATWPVSLLKRDDAMELWVWVTLTEFGAIENDEKWVCWIITSDSE